MSREYLDIVPTWRKATEAIRIIRNPRREDQRFLFSEPWFGTRFVALGDGSLLVGRAEDFLHHDAHTALRKTYGANVVWMGMLFLTKSPKTEFSDISDSQDRDMSEKLVLLREMRYGKRDIGTLAASRTWCDFTSGLWDFEPLEALEAEGVTTNPYGASIPLGEHLCVLHGDGNVYLSENNESIWPFMRLLEDVERNTLARHQHLAMPQVIARLNVQDDQTTITILTSEGSDPVALLNDNTRWRTMWRHCKIVYEIPSRHAIAEP